MLQRRLVAAGALLGVAALLSTSALWGDPARDRDLRAWRAGDDTPVIKPVEDDTAVSDDIVHDRNRFADVPVITYEAPGGELHFALQVQPKLPDEPARPTDYLVIVDTSASKANGYLAASVHIARELARRLGADDRLALWTANIKATNLTGEPRGKGKELDEALEKLDGEIPLGAVDLKKTLKTALETIESKPGRRRALIYLGDGKSVANPVDASERQELCDALIKKNMPFHAVPLGPKIDSQNLHGLISGTGGKCIRAGLREKVELLLPRLLKDVAGPVLYAPTLKLSADASEVLPSKMPPLRRDVPTLVIGKLKAGTKSIDVSVNGEASGKAVKAEAAHKVPAADAEFFFLAGMASQWKTKPGVPALLAADRTLGFSLKQNQLALNEVIGNAESALEENKPDTAKKLFEKAQVFAPNNARAKAGVKLADEVLAGKKTRAQLLEEVRSTRARREIVKMVDGKRVIEVLPDTAEAADDEDPKVAAPDAVDPVKDILARKAIAQQQANAMVSEAVDQARRLVRTDPGAATDVLKRTQIGLDGNPDLDAKLIDSLKARLSREMEAVDRVGRVVARDIAQAAALRAAADARLDVRRQETLAQDRIRERMRVFHNLMDQARELEASRQAESIRKDLVNEGLPVPSALTAAYRIGQSGFYLREVREMRRQREEGFLSVLHEVERSHVPFPDEPPVEFPSRETLKKITRGRFDNWADFSKFRILRYGMATFGSDIPGAFMDLRRELNKTVDWEELDDPKATLRDVLNLLRTKYKVKAGFDYNDKAFKKAYGDSTKDVRDEIIGKLEANRLSLGGLLKRILSKITVGGGGATYIIRRDVIEITTEEAQVKEKALRVYPVSDLVIPIPNSINQQAVGQTATILGSLGQLGLAGGGIQLGGGLQLGGGIQLGGGLQLGGIQLGGGLQLGGIQLGGVQLGGVQLGGVQLGGVQLGGVQVGGVNIGGMQMVGGIQIGGGNCQGAVNLGVQGGAQGFTGGQLGQLGNLGGQFGFQGGSQEQILMQIIRQTVGKPRDWLMQYNPVTGQPCNPLDDEKAEGSGILGQDNQLGYYPPALALVVKGTTRLHTRESNLEFAPVGDAAPKDGTVAAPGGGKDPLVFGKDVDPKTVWKKALDRAEQKPGVVIATADFLALNKRFDHAAEFLKANLRKGLVVQPWVYKSLAIALREGGGSADDIERAEVSVADMEPMDGKGYLVAAAALAEDKNYERAMAFCKQAARLEPNTPQPYAQAARFAEMAKDVATMEWAAKNLLKQDWPLRNDEYRAAAMERVAALSKNLDKADAARLKKAAESGKRRDLVIKLVFQGNCDLDLKVEEPSGSMCTVLQRQSIGGGTLVADALSGTSTNTESYAASEAFSGEYKVFIERMWGKPLGGKAQLLIIRHQGTADESEELVPLKIDSNSVGPISVKLAGGRRTETAYVPSPDALQIPEDEATAKKDGHDDIQARLRAMADPESTGVAPGVAGGVGGVREFRPSRPAKASSTEKPSSIGKAASLYQSRVRTLTSGGVDMTTQAVLSADRRTVNVSIKPVFNTAAVSKPVTVNNSAVPGGE